jgi:Type II CAAX prenyl endopeptidase Rce1-like
VRVSIAFGIAIIAVAGVLGAASANIAARVGQRANDPPSGRFPGLVALIGDLVWRGGMVGLLALAFVTTHRSFLHSVASMWTTTHRQTIPAVVAAPAVVVCYGLAFLWSRLPVIGKVSASRPGSYGNAHAVMTPIRLFACLAVRYPITVFVEESLFHGLLQPELRYGLVIANVLFAAYHLQQWRTVPSLLPYTFAGGILYAWTGTLWVPAVVHYGLDAGYALMFSRHQ